MQIIQPVNNEGEILILHEEDTPDDVRKKVKGNKFLTVWVPENLYNSDKWQFLKLAIRTSISIGRIEFATIKVYKS